MMSLVLDVDVNSVHAVRQHLVTEGFEQALNRKKQRRPSRVPIFDEAKERTLIATARVTLPGAVTMDPQHPVLASCSLP